jgi:hypothetical protein
LAACIVHIHDHVLCISAHLTNLNSGYLFHQRQDWVPV